MLVAQSCLTLCDPMDCSLSMGFSRQEYWSGLPFPPPGDLPDPGIGPRSPARQAGSLPAEPPDDIIFSMFRKQERNVLIESESESEVAQSCPTLCDPVDCSLPAPPSVGFSRQRYWSGVPLPSPEDLPDPGIEPRSTCIAGKHFTL